MNETTLTPTQINGILSGWLNQDDPTLVAETYSVAPSVVLSEYVRYDEELQEEMQQSNC